METLFTISLNTNIFSCIHRDRKLHQWALCKNKKGNYYIKFKVTQSQLNIDRAVTMRLSVSKFEEEYNIVVSNYCDNKSIIEVHW